MSHPMPEIARSNTYSKEELLIATMARLFGDGRFMTAGVNSPIPAAAGLLREQIDTGFYVAVHGDPARTPFVDGGAEAFDMAAQGRLDVFVFGGVQVDGRANINLVGIGPYPRAKKRFAGTFGAASLFYLVRNIVLFFPKHDRRTLVEAVDFKSASAIGPKEAYRTGSPKWLLSERCLFRFDLEKERFTLVSLHPGHSLAEVREHTGFSFDIADRLEVTATPTTAELELIRGPVRDALSKAYPEFARKLLANQ